MKNLVKHEVLPSKKELDKIDFEPKDDKLDSTEEQESEEEDPHTRVLRRSVRERMLHERYTPFYFCSNFSLSITDDDPRTIREVVDLVDGKLWEKVMVEEMTALDKNEAWDLVEFLIGRNPIRNKWVFNKMLNS